MAKEKKSIDSGVLAALHMLSNNTVVGLHYLDFVKEPSTMSGVMDLIDKGHVEKIDYDGKGENRHYRITKKGKEYLNKIVAFANKEFYEE